MSEAEGESEALEILRTNPSQRVTDESQLDYVRSGIVPILAASFLWAFVYFFRKTVLYGISAVLLVFANAMIGAIGLFLLCRLDIRESWKIFRSAPLKFLALGFTGVSIGTTLMTVGLDHLDLSVALVLEKLQPIFTLFLAAIFLGERTRRSEVPWVVIALVSSYFVTAKEPQLLQLKKSDIIGVSAICGAAFVWGVSGVIGRSLAKNAHDFRQLAFLRLVIGGIILLPVVCLTPAIDLRFQPDVYIVSVIVLSSIFGSAGGYMLYYQGLRHVPAAVASFLELVTPLVGIVLGIAFLGERLQLSQQIAIPVMLFAVYRLSRRKP